jgi:hypothetical protein
MICRGGVDDVVGIVDVTVDVIVDISFITRAPVRPHRARPRRPAARLLMRKKRSQSRIRHGKGLRNKSEMTESERERKEKEKQEKVDEMK